MRSVFVSGGAGFIGSHLIRRLLKTPELRHLVVFDNFSSGSLEHLAEVSNDSRLRIVRGDLKNVEEIKSALAGAELVVHLAANPDIAKAVTQPDIDFWEGTYLLQNMLEAMRQTGVRELLYTSGSGIYGENANVAFREDYGPCVPISTYGASKLACEALISAYCHMFDMRARAFRFANVVGPRQTHGVGYDFVRRLLSDPTRLRILGDGTQRKSYIYVEDILNAVFFAHESGSERYNVFNVATGDYITVREIADIAIEVCGIDPRNVQLEFTGGDRGWKGDVPIVQFNCEKISALGWKCQRTSGQALRDSMIAMRQQVLAASAKRS
ncbi:NAD-dependent dehydratase [Opitutaceae bacterium EW11]|nr:NAD-dependent dehydratase [Opitutaceae bacterium EW11]